MHKEHTYRLLSIFEVAVLPGEATLDRTVALLDLIFEGIKYLRANLGKAKVTRGVIQWSQQQVCGTGHITNSCPDQTRES